MSRGQYSPGTGCGFYRVHIPPSPFKLVKQLAASTDNEAREWNGALRRLRHARGLTPLAKPARCPCGNKAIGIADGSPVCQRCYDIEQRMDRRRISFNF